MKNKKVERKECKVKWGELKLFLVGELERVRQSFGSMSSDLYLPSESTLSPLYKKDQLAVKPWREFVKLLVTVSYEESIYYAVNLL